MSLGKEHFEKVWEKKNVKTYIPNSNLRVETVARLLRPGQRLLDVGCGDGTLGMLVRNSFEELYGVDISSKAVELARERGIRAYNVNLNEEKLPFQDNYFETLTCLSVLQYIHDVYFAIREFRRVLQLGGELLLVFPNMRSYRRIVKLVVFGEFPRTSFDDVGYDGGTIHYFCYKNIKKLLENEGFKVMMHKGIFCYPRFLEKFPDRGWFGKLKAEFFGAETLVKAVKIVE